MRHDGVVWFVIAVGALLTGFLFVIAADSWLRALLTTLFLLVGPGLAIVRMLRIADGITEMTLAVATSLGLETVLSTALLVMGWWSPGRALAIVIAITLLCLIISVARQPGLAAGDGFRQAAQSALGGVDGKGNQQ